MATSPDPTPQEPADTPIDPPVPTPTDIPVPEPQDYPAPGTAPMVEGP